MFSIIVMTDVLVLLQQCNSFKIVVNSNFTIILSDVVSWTIGLCLRKNEQTSGPTQVRKTHDSKICLVWP